jgi:hypothetical protein
MTFAILAVLITGAVCLGMLSALMPLRQPCEEVELADLSQDEFFDIGGPIIDLEATR